MNAAVAGRGVRALALFTFLVAVVLWALFGSGFVGWWIGNAILQMGFPMWLSAIASIVAGVTNLVLGFIAFSLVERRCRI